MVVSALSYLRISYGSSKYKQCAIEINIFLGEITVVLVE